MVVAGGIETLSMVSRREEHTFFDLEWNTMNWVLLAFRISPRSLRKSLIRHTSRASSSVVCCRLWPARYRATSSAYWRTMLEDAAVGNLRTDRLKSTGPRVDP